jgi:hypothetical protein
MYGRLWVKSASLEVVWCAAAARWARRFACAPWAGARPPAVASAATHTKNTLTRHWAHIMRANPVFICNTITFHWNTHNLND